MSNGFGEGPFGEGPFGGEPLTDGGTGIGPDRYIRKGSPYESGVWIRDSGRDGPTAVVVGGLHGDEPAGYRTAARLTRATVEKGKLVILPRANKVGFDRESHSTGSGGDLNRCFPTGRRPTSKLARAVWNVVTSANPDVVLDLHSSGGLYQREPSGVGQCIFPTPKGRPHAEVVCKYLNNRYMDNSGFGSKFDWRVGNDQNGRNPLLAHKVGGDLNLPGYIVEATRHQTTLGDRLEWEYAAAIRLLARHGIVVE